MHTLEVPSDCGTVRIHYDGAFDGDAFVCYWKPGPESDRPADREWRVDAVRLRTGRLHDIPDIIPVEVVTRIVSAFTRAYLYSRFLGALEDALGDEP